MKKAVILEDNPKGLANLKNMLAQNCSDIQVVAHATSVHEGFKLLHNPKRQPDIAFLDIKLEDGLVFDLLDQLEEINFELVFVTAYDKFTRQACEYGCIGYIEKPIDPDELKAAVDRIRPGKKYWNRRRVEVFESHFHQHPNPYRQMAICATNGWHFFHIADIAYLRSEDNCTWFHLLDDRKFLVCRTMGDYEDLLQPFNFFRIHRSCIINLNELDMYGCNSKGCFVRLKNGVELKVSRRRRPLLLAALRRLMKSLEVKSNEFSPYDA
jgi:two-component system LytT family response regulator